MVKSSGSVQRDEAVSSRALLGHTARLRQCHIPPHSCHHHHTGNAAASLVLTLRRCSPLRRQLIALCLNLSRLLAYTSPATTTCCTLQLWTHRPVPTTSRPTRGLLHIWEALSADAAVHNLSLFATFTPPRRHPQATLVMSTAHQPCEGTDEGAQRRPTGRIKSGSDPALMGVGGIAQHRSMWCSSLPVPLSLTTTHLPHCQPSAPYHSFAAAAALTPAITSVMCRLEPSQATNPSSPATAAKLAEWSQWKAKQRGGPEVTAHRGVCLQRTARSWRAAAHSTERITRGCYPHASLLLHWQRGAAR